MNRNLELKQRLERLQEEKNAADVRCTELKQALEEFIFSTDKRGIEEDQEDGKPLEESVDGKITLIKPVGYSSFTDPRGILRNISASDDSFSSTANG
jgi:hypothetical protein